MNTEADTPKPRRYMRASVLGHWDMHGEWCQKCAVCKAHRQQPIMEYEPELKDNVCDYCRKSGRFVRGGQS